jgi:hypothetical protein
MHYHDKEMVVAYRESGALVSVTPLSKETAHSFGQIRFDKGPQSLRAADMGPPERYHNGTEIVRDSNGRSRSPLPR